MSLSQDVAHLEIECERLGAELAALKTDLAISAQAERGQRERADRLEEERRTQETRARYAEGRWEQADSELGVLLARADDGTPVRECAACAGKPGSPILCDACHSNRDLVAGLRELLAREKAAHVKTMDELESEIGDQRSRAIGAESGLATSRKACAAHLLKLDNAELDLAVMGRKANELSTQLAVVRKQRDETNAAAHRAEARLIELGRQIDTERTEAGKKIAKLEKQAADFWTADKARVFGHPGTLKGGEELDAAHHRIANARAATVSAAVVGPAALTLEESGNAEYAINHCHPSDEQAVVARAALRLSAALATAEAQAREAAARVGVLERALAVSEAKGQAAHDALANVSDAEDVEHVLALHVSELPVYYRRLAADAAKAKRALEMTEEEADAFEERVAAPTPPKGRRGR